jgi:hypothetical protein
MFAIFDLLYREYCRVRLAEMRRQFLISPKSYEATEAPCDAGDAFGASPTDDREARCVIEGSQTDGRLRDAGI